MAVFRSLLRDFRFIRDSACRDFCVWTKVFTIFLSFLAGKGRCPCFLGGDFSGCPASLQEKCDFEGYGGRKTCADLKFSSRFENFFVGFWGDGGVFYDVIWCLFSC